MGSIGLEGRCSIQLSYTPTEADGNRVPCRGSAVNRNLDAARVYHWGRAIPECLAEFVYKDTARQKMGWPTGLEPATSGVTIRCSTR